MLIIRLGNVYTCTVEGSHGLFVKLWRPKTMRICAPAHLGDAALRVTRIPGVLI